MNNETVVFIKSTVQLADSRYLIFYDFQQQATTGSANTEGNPPSASKEK